MENGRGVFYPNDTWIYNRVNGTWRMVHDGRSSTSLPGRAFTYFGMLRVDATNLFVISHGTKGENFFSDFEDTWVFNMETHEWTEIIPSGGRPGPRNAGFYGIAYDNADTLWLGGGFVSDELGRTIETFKLTFTSPTEAQWEKVYGQSLQYNPLKPHSRRVPSSTVVGRDKLVVLGGCTRLIY